MFYCILVLISRECVYWSEALRFTNDIKKLFFISDGQPSLEAVMGSLESQLERGLRQGNKLAAQSAIAHLQVRATAHKDCLIYLQIQINHFGLPKLKGRRAEILHFLFSFFFLCINKFLLRNINFCCD